MDYVTRQFINLAKKLHRDLRKALQKQTAAISQAAKAARENKQDPLPVPLPVVAELQIPEADKREQRCQHRQSHALQIWLTVGTWLAFIAAAVYASIAAFQWRTMNKTYIEIRKQTAAAECTAGAAQTQASLMMEQLKGTMAAVLRFDVSIDQSNPFRLALYINRLNPAGSGVIAHRVTTKLVVKILALPSQKQIGGPYTFTEGPEDLRPVTPDEERQGEGQILKKYAIPGFNEQTWNEMRRLEKTMRVDKYFSYENGFGDTIARTRCQSYLAYEFGVSEPIIEANEPHAQRLEWVNCQSFDGMLQEAFKSKADAQRTLERLLQKERKTH
jgi:hypothetical protein